MGDRSGPPERRVRRAFDLASVLVGLGVLGVGMLVVRSGTVPTWERRLFERVNDLPDGLYPLLWPFQQIGALVAGPLVAVVALLARRRRLAIAALAVTIGKLVTERLVKSAVSRSRPYLTIGPDIAVRGDVPQHGASFVSGHAVLVAALAGVVTRYLPARWRLVPWIAVVLVAVGRVYVGAHLPLDVVAGAALGLVLAGLANLALGDPGRSVSA